MLLIPADDRRSRGLLADDTLIGGYGEPGGGWLLGGRGQGRQARLVGNPAWLPPGRKVPKAGPPPSRPPPSQARGEGRHVLGRLTTEQLRCAPGRGRPAAHLPPADPPAGGVRPDEASLPSRNASPCPRPWRTVAAPGRRRQGWPLAVALRRGFGDRRRNRRRPDNRCQMAARGQGPPGGSPAVEFVWRNELRRHLHRGDCPGSPGRRLARRCSTSGCALGARVGAGVWCARPTGCPEPGI